MGEDQSQTGRRRLTVEEAAGDPRRRIALEELEKSMKRRIRDRSS